MRLSQSVLSSAGDCQRKAQYTLDRPAWAQRVGSAPRAVGTGFHAGLELYYQARHDDMIGVGPGPGILPTLDDCVGRAIEIFNTSMTTDLYDDTPIDAFLWDDKIPDIETAHQYITAMVTAYWPHHWPDDWQVLAVELHGTRADPYIGADVKIGADLVLVDPNNWLVGVDFKTAGRRWQEGKEHPRKNVQAPFYLRLLRQIFPGHAGYRFVFDVMTYPNKSGECVFERRISDPTPLHEQAVADNAKAFVNLYQTIHVEQGLDLPVNPASTLCSARWCDMWSGCPSGAALN